MYEVDFSGFERTPETLKKCKDDFWFRLSVHFKRFRKALKYRRWSHFNFYNIVSLLLNRNIF